MGSCLFKGVTTMGNVNSLIQILYSGHRVQFSWRYATREYKVRTDREWFRYLRTNKVFIHLDQFHLMLENIHGEFISIFNLFFGGKIFVFVMCWESGVWIKARLLWFLTLRINYELETPALIVLGYKAHLNLFKE